MSFPRDAYPYTNFHELNLGYFITHFREIFSQWADLYDQMTDWKDATDEELATWKAGVEDDLDQREAALRAELETWKAQTGQDIAGWEDATLAALTAWQTATQAVFEAIRVEAAGSATAAAASAGDAATAKTAAETAQAAAEAAAASIASSAAQIATNTADISDLKTQINEIVNANFQKIDVKTFFADTKNFLGFTAQGVSVSNTYYIRCNASSTYNSYAFVPISNSHIYVDVSELETVYYSIIIGKNAAANTWNEVSESRWEIECPSQSIRYRYYGDEDTLPTVNNPLEITPNDVVVITTRANTNDTPLYIDGYYTLTDDVSLGQTQVNQVINTITPLIPALTKTELRINAWKQEGGIVRDIDIYVPTLTEGKYFKYNIHKYTSSPKNSNGWVMNGFWLVDENDNVLMNICPSGEWEMAIKLKEQSDFIGLRNHGNEQTAYNKFYVDGHEVSESAVAQYTGNTFRMVQITDMFLPDSPTTKCGTHYLEAIFDSHKIRFNQRVKWELDGLTGQGDFIAMFPVQRTNDGIQVTDYAYDGNTFMAYDVSEEGFTHYMREYVPRDSISIYGTTSGIFATVKILTEMPNTHYAFVQNNNLYNKVYFSYIGPDEEINNGDVWEWKSEYEIIYKDVT